MTNTDIITELSLKWAGKTAVEIATDVDVIFGGVLAAIPEPEHNAIGSELKQIGIMTNYTDGQMAQGVGICKRKKAPVVN